MKKKVLPVKPSYERVEHCENPWNGECKNTDIELYIVYRGKQLPICHSCWSEIAEKDLEWSGDYAF